MKQANVQCRKTFLIDKRIQGKLGKRILFHWLLFFVLSVTLNIALRVVGNVDQLPMVELLQQVAREQAVATLVILALLPWFINDTIKLSHRLVGPIQRIRSAVRQLTENDELQPIVLRKGDFFVDFANEFNSLRTKVLQERSELVTVKQQLVAQSSEMDVAYESTPITPVVSCLDDTIVIEPGRMQV